MVPVKSTAALLVASMSFFSVAHAAPARSASHPSLRTPGTPIAGSSSDGSGTGTTTVPGSTTGSTGSTGTGSTGGGSTTGTGSNPGSPSIPGNGGSVGVGGNNGTMSTGASPISSGNRPDSSSAGGNNAPRPGPRAPVDQPGVGGTGPFGQAPTPRTMDGTEGTGFNFGNILSGINSMTSTIFQLIATFGMLKQIFGSFGKDKGDAAKTDSSAATEVAAVADRGTNVARDASTKIDDAIEAERARREGTGSTNGDGTPGNPDEAQSSGLARD